MGKTSVLHLPPPITQEQSALGIARSLYIDGTIDVHEFERFVGEIIAGRRVNFARFGFAIKPASPSYSER